MKRRNFFMPFTELNEENKLHLNLSPNAMAIIEHDMLAFQVKRKSTFLNEIIENFRSSASASLTLSSERYRSELEFCLLNESKASLSDAESQVLDRLVTAYQNKILNSHSQKGCGFKIRINNENMKYLTTICEENMFYGDIGIGAYLKALVEEYCQKPYVQREKIYARDTFTEIENAIQNNKKLSIRFAPKHTKKVLPYAIKSDPLSMYHYLIGYSENKKIVCYRMTALKNNVTCLLEKTFISTADKKTLENCILERGVQFVSGELIECKVELTKYGEELYQKLLHLRPAYTEKNGNIYSFLCNEAQIEFYFFKFGPEAKIISPPNLKKHFKRKYEAAVKRYAD